LEKWLSDVYLVAVGGISARRMVSRCGEACGTQSAYLSPCARFGDKGVDALHHVGYWPPIAKGSMYVLP